MSNEKKPNATSNIFANALASTPKYVDQGVSAGMQRAITCTHCGAARESGAGGVVEEKLVCRYCGTPFFRGAPR